MRAVLRTNDPQNNPLNLEIKGQINPQVRISPENWAYIDFDQLTAGKPTERILNVYSTRLNQFSLAAALRNGAEPAAFVAEVKPLEPGSEVDGQKVKSGYSVVLRTVNNLPRGYLLRDLVLSITVPGETAREVILQVYGKVPNGIFTIHPEDEIQFTKKNLADGDEARVVVQFAVPKPDEKVEVVRCEPPFLVADAPRLAVAGQPGRWIFTLRIPKNSAEAMKFQPDEFFEGAVYLKVTGSDTDVSVRVKWVPSGKQLSSDTDRLPRMTSVASASGK
jgi:hypothetical protein